MLACLPASRDHTVRLLSRTQMNTGLQKWETTQKMRSASNPTPAELDAYAKRIANHPLSIQIFPNSVKVPQRKHIRRTVNGLDTSSSAQRHSPYPSQVSASAGLLAVLRAPVRGVVKESDGSRTRLLHKAVMNPHSGPYATQSTLNLPGPSQAGPKQGMVHPQVSMTHPLTLPPHPQALQQRSMAHPRLPQLQTTQQQRLAHPPQGLQPGSSCPGGGVVPPQQHLAHLQTHQAPPLQPPPPPALLSQQGASQDLRHLSDGVPSLQHSQGVAQPPGGAGTTPTNGLQQPPPGAYGPRKLPDADAPPNVTVSTSTIPLSMAASLHQNRAGDLSSIVHQINQLCQARAGMGATSVCEGQIANPSPISRNLLINASSRVSSHHPALGSSCLLLGPPPDKAAAQTPNMAFHGEAAEAAQLQQQQQQQQLQLHHLQQQKQQQQHLQHLQQLQQQQRSWAQHQLAHMQQPPEGAHPCKNPRMEAPTECAFPSRNLNYSHKLPHAAQSFPLKHPAEKPPSPANCPLGPMPYVNSHYMQPPWGNSGPGPQDLPGAYQGGRPLPTGAERVPGAKYRPGKEGPPGGPAKPMANVDFLGGDFQMPGFQEQNLDVMEKMHRSAMGHVQEPGNGGSLHSHHHGYR